MDKRRKRKFKQKIREDGQKSMREVSGSSKINSMKIEKSGTDNN